MTQYGNIGEIWRFDAPPWKRANAPAHYLITDITFPEHSRYDVYYVCIHLESGLTVTDLLIDEANIANYNARKVA